MKLLHEVTRLRSRVRLLLTDGRRKPERRYVVTVPAPLGRLTVAPTPSAAGLLLPAIADNAIGPSSMRLAGHG